MVRYPTLYNHVGGGIPSPTGVPEGCSISVLEMLTTSWFYYFRVCATQVQPYAYADNWNWCSKSQRQHFEAYQRMQRTVEVLRLQLDYNKSWHWATSKEFRCARERFHIDLGEADKVAIKTQTKDLGEMFHYNKSASLGFFKDWILNGSQLRYRKKICLYRPHVGHWHFTVRTQSLLDNNILLRWGELWLKPWSDIGTWPHHVWPAAYSQRFCVIHSYAHSVLVQGSPKD